MFLMKILKNKSGLILAEALVAVSTLVIASIIVTGIIKSSLKVTALSRNYLIAQNLATEAIEGVKSFRDTNWLKAPNDHQECWMVVDLEVGDTDLECLAKESITHQTDESYIVTSTEEGWGLFGEDVELAEVDGEEVGVFESIDLGVVALDNFFPFVIEFVPDGMAVNVPSGEAAPPNSESSGFYRYVEVLYVDEHEAHFEVNVEWLMNNKARKVERNFIIYNF